MGVRSLFNGDTQYFIINKNTRVITPPTDFKNFGVESDENSNRVYFQCPRYVGDNLDLTTLSVRVNYQNANSEKDQYIVTDVTVDGENVYFSWVLSRKATAYKGNIHFIVCAVKTDSNGVITNEWNTTMASGTVLSGLEVETPVIPEDTLDIVNQLLSMVETAASDLETAANNAKETVKVAETEAIEAVSRTPNSVYANALKGSANDEIIAVNDVSPVEHNVIVNVKSKNIAKTVNVGNVTNAYNSCLWVECEFLPDTTYAISFVGAVGHKFYINEHLFRDYGVVECDGTRQTLIQTTVSEVSKENTSTQYTTGKGWLVGKNNSDNETLPAFSEVQLEKGDVATEYTPYIAPESVTLMRCGKNILPSIDSYTNSGYTANVNADGSITVSGSANVTNDIYFNLSVASADMPVRLAKGQLYAIQGWSSNGQNIYVKTNNSSGESNWTNIDQWAEKNVGTDYTDIVHVYTESKGHEIGDTSLCGTYKVQLEVGGAPTDYEPYNSVSYTPDSNGNVNAASIAPNMTLFTDTEGTIIDCEYNKDSNIVVQQLIDRITALENS